MPQPERAGITRSCACDAYGHGIGWRRVRWVRAVTRMVAVRAPCSAPSFDELCPVCTSRSDNREAMDSIVEVLLQKETISGHEFREMLAKYVTIPAGNMPAPSEEGSYVPTL